MYCICWKTLRHCCLEFSFIYLRFKNKIFCIFNISFIFEDKFLQTLSSLNYKHQPFFTTSLLDFVYFVLYLFINSVYISVCQQKTFTIILIFVDRFDYYCTLSSMFDGYSSYFFQWSNVKDTCNLHYYFLIFFTTSSWYMDILTVSRFRGSCVLRSLFYLVVFISKWCLPLRLPCRWNLLWPLKNVLIYIRMVS